MAKPPEERDRALLLDMVLAARDALSFVEGMDEAAFIASTLHQNAVIRSLEVIGEAASKVSPTTRASLAYVAWSEIIAMRNRLIHGYDTVSLERVWPTVREDLGPLITALDC